MINVGLTGNIGSGKTVVADIFKTLGIPVYSADENAKIFLDSKEIMKSLVKNFGSSVVGSNGLPDRKKIAEIVFNDINALDALNKIIHPLVINDFKNWIRKQKNCPYVIMESAILFESGYDSGFNKIILISASEKIRMQRVMKRDNAKASDVKKRMLRQLPEKTKKEKSDFVILNNGRNALIPQVLRIHQSLLSII